MEKLNRPYRVVLVLALIVVVGGLLTYFIFLSPEGYLARQHADIAVIGEEESASYIALDGSTADLESYRGEVLVLNIWASWSPYTEADHATLARIKAAYGDRITVLALDRKEPKETAEAYLNQIGKKDGIEYIIDETDHLFSSVGGYAMPETIVFDQVGNIALHVRGVVKEDELKAGIDALLSR